MKYSKNLKRNQEALIEDPRRFNVRHFKSIHILIDDELSDLINTGVKAFNENGFDCTITNWSRLALRQFAKRSIEEQIGLTFRPPVKDEDKDKHKSKEEKK